ncbi:hypothetical protein ACTFR8_22590 [Bacillus cereus group sp. MYBK15-3]|uniref:hypothetical protein n=1 Tax=unclassified Bacillus cereus group TaxID=2750818 RepID=UPI003F7B10E2
MKHLGKLGTAEDVKAWEKQIEQIMAIGVCIDDEVEEDIDVELPPMPLDVNKVSLIDRWVRGFHCYDTGWIGDSDYKLYVHKYLSKLRNVDSLQDSRLSGLNGLGKSLSMYGALVTAKTYKHEKKGYVVEVLIEESCGNETHLKLIEKFREYLKENNM